MLYWKRPITSLCGFEHVSRENARALTTDEVDARVPREGSLTNPRGVVHLQQAFILFILPLLMDADADDNDDNRPGANQLYFVRNRNLETTPTPTPTTTTTTTTSSSRLLRYEKNLREKLKKRAGKKEEEAAAVTFLPWVHSYPLYIRLSSGPHERQLNIDPQQTSL